MEINISADIRAIIDWEIAQNQNTVEAVYYRQGSPVVAMVRPIRRSRDRDRSEVPPTLGWWEFRDPHYGAADWCAGFESSESGHKVCGPIREELR